MKHQSKDRELFLRAMDRIWQRSQADAARSGERTDIDQRLIADARMNGWKAPGERPAKARA